MKYIMKNKHFRQREYKMKSNNSKVALSKWFMRKKEILIVKIKSTQET